MMLHIGHDQFAVLLREIARRFQLLLPQRRGEKLVLSAAPNDDSAIDFEWNDYRLAEPLKGAWFQPATLLAQWPDELPSETARPPARAIFGAKACDLAALKAVDRVLRVAPNGEPAYT